MHFRHRPSRCASSFFAILWDTTLGSDSDTLACITSGLAEAYYQEIPEEIVKEMWSRLPETLREILLEMRGSSGVRWEICRKEVEGKGKSCSFAGSFSSDSV